MSDLAGASFVEIKMAKGKGLGLFATRDIPRGTRILEERPLVMLPPESKTSDHLWKQFEKMSEPQRTKFRELSWMENFVSDEMKNRIGARLSRTLKDEQWERAVAEEVKMQAIFHGNCVAMGTKSQWGIGVFELYSRINHSCMPNVHNSYNPTLQREVVHAVQDISIGDEIVTSYTENIRNREERQRHLCRYGFQCECAACSGTDAVLHEVRRQRLSDIDQALALQAMGGPLAGMFGGLIDDGEALRKATQSVSLLIEEGLLGMDLAVGYRDCAKLSTKQGKLNDASRYVHLEREVEVYCLGEETEYMEGNDEYAYTRLAAIEEMQSRGQTGKEATGPEKQLPRSARRALAKREAKAAKAQTRQQKTK